MTASAGRMTTNSLACHPRPAADIATPEQAADDESAGPPRVQRVQLARLLVGIQRGDERVDDGLDQAPADAGDERADPDHRVDAGTSGDRSRKHHEERAEREADAGQRAAAGPCRCSPAAGCRWRWSTQSRETAGRGRWRSFRRSATLSIGSKNTRCRSLAVFARSAEPTPAMVSARLLTRNRRAF